MGNYGEFRSARERKASAAELRSAARGIKHPDLRRLALTQAWAGVDMADLAHEVTWIGERRSTWVVGEATRVPFDFPAFRVLQGNHLLALGSEWPNAHCLGYKWALDRTLSFVENDERVARAAWAGEGPIPHPNLGRWNALRDALAAMRTFIESPSIQSVRALLAARDRLPALTRGPRRRFEVNIVALVEAATSPAVPRVEAVVSELAAGDDALARYYHLDFARCLLTALRERDLR